MVYDYRDAEDYSFADAWYANKNMRKDYKSHVIDYYAHLEELEGCQ